MNPQINYSVPGLFARALSSLPGGLSDEAAQTILALKLDAEDATRLVLLSEKAQEDGLTDLEKEELGNFHQFGRIVEVLKSKARTCRENSGAVAEPFEARPAVGK
jgi:hypothetical protein